MKNLITLGTIRTHNPCVAGWQTLVRAVQTEVEQSAYGRPLAAPELLKWTVSIGDVVLSNGVDDAIWCLRCIDDGRAIARCILPAMHHVMADRLAAGVHWRPRGVRPRAGDHEADVLFADVRQAVTDLEAWANGAKAPTSRLAKYSDRRSLDHWRDRADQPAVPDPVSIHLNVTRTLHALLLLLALPGTDGPLAWRSGSLAYSLYLALNDIADADKRAAHDNDEDGNDEDGVTVTSLMRERLMAEFPPHMYAGNSPTMGRSDEDEDFDYDSGRGGYWADGGDDEHAA